MCFGKVSADEMLRFGVMLQYNKDPPPSSQFLGTARRSRKDSNVQALLKTEAWSFFGDSSSEATPSSSAYESERGNGQSGCVLTGLSTLRSCTTGKEKLNERYYCYKPPQDRRHRGHSRLQKRTATESRVFKLPSFVFVSLKQLRNGTKCSNTADHELSSWTNWPAWS